MNVYTKHFDVGCERIKTDNWYVKLINTIIHQVVSSLMLLLESKWIKTQTLNKKGDCQIHSGVLMI